MEARENHAEGFRHESMRIDLLPRVRQGILSVEALRIPPLSSLNAIESLDGEQLLLQEFVQFSRQDAVRSHL